jgi:hypothetical protein
MTLLWRRLWTAALCAGVVLGLGGAGAALAEEYGSAPRQPGQYGQDRPDERRFRNDAPLAPWNQPGKRDDALAPWNQLPDRDDPVAPWNTPGAGQHESNSYLERNGHDDPWYKWGGD